MVRPVCAGCQVNSPRWKCSPWPGGRIGATLTAIGARLHSDVRAVKGRQGSVRGKSPAFCRRRGASRAVSVRKLWRPNRLGERRVLGLSSCAPERATGSTGERDGSVRKMTPFFKRGQRGQRGGFEKKRKRENCGEAPRPSPKFFWSIALFALFCANLPPIFDPLFQKRAKRAKRGF